MIYARLVSRIWSRMIHVVILGQWSKESVSSDNNNDKGCCHVLSPVWLLPIYRRQQHDVTPEFQWHMCGSHVTLEWTRVSIICVNDTCVAHMSRQSGHVYPSRVNDSCTSYWPWHVQLGHCENIQTLDYGVGWPKYLDQDQTGWKLDQFLFIWSDYF